MADHFTQTTVERCVKNLGPYRTQVADEIGRTGEPDAFSGALLLALGIRESQLMNINNAAGTDRGTFQISDKYHAEFLKSQPGCPVGSWKPDGSRHTAMAHGYCPRFTPACLYALDMLKANYAYGLKNGVSKEDCLRFALAAYNAGQGGAMKGQREGDCDKYTTGGDYGAWVIVHRKKVNSSRWYKKYSTLGD